jgi:hypothetical protein
MLARQVLFLACLAACFAIACGDHDSSPNGRSGSSGSSGEAGSTGSGGSATTAGTAGKGGSQNMAGEPGLAGMPGEPLGGAGGVGPETPLAFIDFVHELIESETADDSQPSSVADKQFSEPRDDHEHYLAPASAFDDLF